MHAAMELYLWNVRLSAAFGEVIALAEVILRNAMAEQLATAYGATWYARTELFDDRTMSGFKTTWRNITMPADPATGKPAQKTLHAVPAGKIVAESTFGCWVNLLDKGGTRGDGPYRKNVDYDSTLWWKALHKAFPNSGGKRTTVFTTASHVRSLRNRAAHHEPLIDGVPLPARPTAVAAPAGSPLPTPTPRSYAWSSTSTRTSPPGSDRPAACPSCCVPGRENPAAPTSRSPAQRRRLRDRVPSRPPPPRAPHRPGAGPRHGRRRPGGAAWCGPARSGPAHHPRRQPPRGTPYGTTPASQRSAAPPSPRCARPPATAALSPGAWRAHGGSRPRRSSGYAAARRARPRASGRRRSAQSPAPCRAPGSAGCV
ncbi:Abi family protein [Streptomyces murinus]|uniref:Abi family protein n=1 Tax=Streptomyces murinus TaxID=33900 RepID=UPI003F456697